MVEIKPMDEQYVLTDCLQHGLAGAAGAPRGETQGQDVPDLPARPWSDDTIKELAGKYHHLSGGWAGDACREFMLEMIHRYGTCALLAWENGKILGYLRFYPLSIAQMLANAVTDREAAHVDNALRFAPDPEALWGQCVMTCTPFENAEEALKSGARRGVGLKLVMGLTDWARERGWKRIVKQAHPDLDCFYGVCGDGGKAFWSKAGFRVTEKFRLQPWGGYWESIIEEQRKAKGMSEDEVWTWFRMAIEL